MGRGAKPCQLSRNRSEHPIDQKRKSPLAHKKKEFARLVRHDWPMNELVCWAVVSFTRVAAPVTQHCTAWNCTSHSQGCSLRLSTAGEAQSLATAHGTHCTLR